MKQIGFFFILLMAAAIVIKPASAATFENSLSFKATVISNGVETEWEYINPDEYELEIGNKVVKDKSAKRAVQKLYALLNINDQAETAEMVQALKQHGYDQIERLDVRWMNPDGQLYTWVWEK